jgi:hypothetical protein
MPSSYTAPAESGKPPRVTLLRDYCGGEPLPLRCTPHIVQIDIARSSDGGYHVEAAGTRPIALTASQLRCWPIVQRHIEEAIAFPVQRISRRAWAWDLAKRGLAPWTKEAEQFDEANDRWFDRNFEKHCVWIRGVADDMAAERKRA